MVYSHDAFGLGNIRRMLAICQYLLETFADLSILVVSGSPALHRFRFVPGLDYIKLPCLGRNSSGQLAVKFLETQTDETIELRSQLILSTVAHFKPDLLLVDKKPDGLAGELQRTLNFLETHHPQAKLVLVLRDILDRADVTVRQWQQQGYYDIVSTRYDRVWVVGTPEIFNVCQEYRFPPSVARKVEFCGYIHRASPQRSPSAIRQELNVKPDEPFVLVTSGGGGDGYHLVRTYLEGLLSQPEPRRVKSSIVLGPEMSRSQQQTLTEMADACPHAQVSEFTDELTSYLNAADLVVSMGGYNTVTEILSFKKRAIVVPRVYPVEEQWIRAERMAKRGLFRVIHPDNLTPKILMEQVFEELQSPRDTANSSSHTSRLDLNALPRIARYCSALLNHQATDLPTLSFESHSFAEYSCVAPASL